MHNRVFSLTGTIAAVVLIGGMLCVNAFADAPRREVIASLQVSNSLSVMRKEESVIIPFGKMGLSQSDPRAKYLLAMEDGKAVPQQLIDTDADGKPDALLISASFPPHKTRYFKIFSDPQTKPPTLRKRTQAEISIKQGGQWDGNVYKGGHFVNEQHVKLPPQSTGNSKYIRYEGPGVESDKVAYRVYFDRRNGFDVFGKKTPGIVLQSIGKDDSESYENDAPWGLDIFDIGNSLGTGGFGYWNGKQVEQVAVTDSREADIVANGNLYSAFNIQYGHWRVNHGVYDLSAMVSMNAGSRVAHALVRINASGNFPVPIPVMAIGVVKHPDTKLIQSDPSSNLEWGYAASWGKQSRAGRDDSLGVGVIFHRTQRVKQTQDDDSYVSVMDVGNGILDYYFFAAWDKEPGGIKTEDEFKAFLDNEVQRLSSPLRVTSAGRRNMKVH